MKVQQFVLSDKTWWGPSALKDPLLNNVQLVLIFASSSVIQKKEVYELVRNLYPDAEFIVSSASGEIVDNTVYDDSISVTAIHFDTTRVRVISEDIDDGDASFSAGWKWIEKLISDDLRHVLVFSDGNITNGDKLIQWCRNALPNWVTMSWGLAGWAIVFWRSYVSHNSMPDDVRRIVFVWLYGEDLKIGTWSCGGWDIFWPKRVVTKSCENVVYEFDGEPALDLYERYLWDEAKNLPASGVIFPMNISETLAWDPIVRTILEINREEKSITFGWDIPQWHYAQMMKANFERLIDGSQWAWEQSIQHIDNPDLALLISCLWRRLVLKHRIDREVEVIRDLLWPSCCITGFYSHWEIWPSWENMLDCQFHNQTMTITLLSEK